MRSRRDVRRDNDARAAAGNGLLNRRVFLKGGAAAAGAFMAFASETVAAPPETPPGMKMSGAALSPYGSPAEFEREVTRTLIRSQPGTTGAGASRTPLETLEGMITPSGLHFERHHNGVPTIDPAQHQLLIHGMVARPLVFTMATLSRYPMESRIHFLECSGNSQLMYQPTPPTLTCGQTHGLVSCSEWTGVPLRLLLEEAGADSRADWILAEGADAAAMSRSVPMAKAKDDALLALYQNGERLRPENGYPVRLFLPGYEGNMSVKWLRRIKVTDTPTMTKDETSKYTITLSDGKSLQFVFPQECKSVITRPSPGLTMKAPGVYEITGLAWSGYGKIAKVEISADGGKSWAPAALQEPVLSKALTRFRMAWRWNGGPAVLQSRATDDIGYVQPTRERMIADRGSRAIYHSNAVTTWGVSEKGEVKHVYA